MADTLKKMFYQASRCEIPTKDRCRLAAIASKRKANNAVWDKWITRKRIEIADGSSNPEDHEDAEHNQ